MKKFTAIMMVVGMVLFLGAAQASAQQFSFLGGYTISNLEGGTFAESISFNNFFGSGSGAITVIDPADAIITMGDYIELPTLKLSESSYISGVSYDFAPTTYAQGFEVYDTTLGLLFSADLEVTTLDVVGKTFDINPNFTMNLSNITAGAGYTAGSSYIVDMFLANGGATQITMQLGELNVANVLEGGTGAVGTYSGVAAASSVPEPATMLLLGSGLLGLMGVRRKRS